MIPLSLGHILFGYGASLAAGLVALWLWHSWRTARRENRSRRQFTQCAACSTIYDRAGEILPVCPLCHRPNEHNPPPSV